MINSPKIERMARIIGEHLCCGQPEIRFLELALADMAMMVEAETLAAVAQNAVTASRVALDALDKRRADAAARGGRFG